MSENGHDGASLTYHSQVEVIDCTHCGFAHIASGGHSASEYEEDHFYADDTWFKKEQDEHLAELWNSFYDFQWAKLGDPKSLIDVGCGSGWFLWRQLQTGNITYTQKGTSLHYFGVDSSPSAYVHAMNYVKTLLGNTYDNRLGLGYDAVHMGLVLEHIERPLDYLRAYFHSWHPYRVCIVVPNEFNPLQKRVGGNWFVSPWHWNYFTPNGLTHLLDLVGFKPYYRGATFPMELFILMGLDYRGHDELGKKCHRARLLWEKFFGTRIFELYGLLHRRYGWGRELVYFFDRKDGA